MKHLFHLLPFWLFFSLLGCSAVTFSAETPTPNLPPSPTAELSTPTPLPLEIEPTIERIDVLITAEEITTIIAGTLAGDCWAPTEPVYSRLGSNITIQFTTTRPENASCTLESQPFELRVPILPEELSNGFYAITVNDQPGTSFTYDAQQLASAGGLLEVSGRIWHDLCAYQAGEQITQPPTGCKAEADNNSYLANGTLEEGEQGVAQVVVQIGGGECPAAPLLTTTTDQDGRYSFPEVSAGNYCVMILSDAGSNELLLAPGQWTAPAAIRGDINAYVTVNQSDDAINFGWDYRLLPRTATQRACDDKALLVQEVNYPADTRVSAGEIITKTWRLQNVGTCSWSDSYRLVWSEGNVRTAETIELDDTIVPGEIADISAEVTIPQGFGRYRGAWWLQNGQGGRFGTGINGNNPLTLNVVVPAPPATLTPAVTATSEE